MKTIKVRGHVLNFISAMAAREFVHDYTSTTEEVYNLVCFYENNGRLKPTGINFNDGWQLDGSYESVSKELLEQVK